MTIPASDVVLVETSAHADLARAVALILTIALLVVGVVGVQQTRSNRHYGEGSREVHCISLRILAEAHPAAAVNVGAAHTLEGQCR